MATPQDWKIVRILGKKWHVSKDKEAYLRESDCGFYQTRFQTATLQAGAPGKASQYQKHHRCFQQARAFSHSSLLQRQRQRPQQAGAS